LRHASIGASPIAELDALSNPNRAGRVVAPSTARDPAPLSPRALTVAGYRSGYRARFIRFFVHHAGSAGAPRLL